jgi:signal transduction histidine kinase/ligand-binding sensor domain-containing protein
MAFEQAMRAARSRLRDRRLLRTAGLFMLASVAAIHVAAAQNATLRVRHYTADDGLAQNRVRRVLQDREGFIWVATQRGLQRFDGYSFVPYSSLDTAAPPALGHLTTGLRQDQDGALWVEADGEVFRIDAATHRLTRISLGADGTEWATDGSGRVWIRRLGRLEIVDPSTPSQSVRTFDAPWLSDGAPVILMPTRAGALWVIGASGPNANVARFDPATGNTQSHRLETITLATGALEDSTGRLWVSGRGGVEFLHRDTQRFWSVSELRGVDVSALATDGKTIVAATSRWLARIDAAARVTERWDPPEIFSSDAMAEDIFVDRESGIWLATTAVGLFRLERGLAAFEHLSSHSTPALPLATDFVTALAERRDGTMWVGTLHGGAYRLTPDAGHVDAFRHDPLDASSLPADLIWDFEQDRDGNLWIATGNGLCTPATNGFRCARPSGESEFTDLARTPQGPFWTALHNNNTIASFDPATARFGRAVALRSEIFALYVDPDSNFLWVGGTALLRARIRGGDLLEPLTPVESGRPSDKRVVFAFHRDSGKVLWLGTDIGLQRWDPKALRFASVEVAELRATTVFSIEEEPGGSLWLGTAHGLVHYSPTSGIARRYRRQDGVLSGEFNRRAALRRRNGEMIFGGVEGLTRFRPEFVTKRRTSPPIVFNRWTRVRGGQLLDESIRTADHLELGPDDRAFTIDFAALGFASGPSKRYRYRLEGLTPEWIESAEHVATFAAPPPGQYVFRVQSSAGGEGEWGTPGGSLVVQVVPPFWKTAWFRVLVFLGAVVAAWLLHRVTIARAVATERLRLRISRDLHDELGAGLSSIALLSDSVGRTGAVTERDRTQLHRIAESARDMVADLRDIVWAIDPNGDEVEDVVARMKDVASTLLKGVRVSFDAPPPVALTDKIGMAARRDLLLLFKELLHNIARHAKASVVHIAFEIRGDELRLTVSDDGVGFDPTEARLGTGLKSMRERATRLRGHLDVSSELGRGTIVRLSMRTT